MVFENKIKKLESEVELLKSENEIIQKKVPEE